LNNAKPTISYLASDCTKDWWLESHSIPLKKQRGRAPESPITVSHYGGPSWWPRHFHCISNT